MIVVIAFSVARPLLACFVGFVAVQPDDDHPAAVSG
jgi:hypothetical protein